MSINTAHANGGVLIHSGECILLHNKNGCIMFSNQKSPVFQGRLHGHIYLTSHRMIFKTKRQTEILLSFSAPFIAMKDVELELPYNYIKGTVRAQPNGNYTGEVEFILHFKSGGAIEYAKALQCAATIARDNWMSMTIYPENMPPYTPSRAWYEAPEAMYKTPQEYKKWLPECTEFTSPKPNSVFMTDNPAPYPGIGKMNEHRDPKTELSGVEDEEEEDRFIPVCSDCEPYNEDRYSYRQSQADNNPWTGFIRDDNLANNAARAECMYEDSCSNYPDTTARTEVMHEDWQSVHGDGYLDYPEKDDNQALTQGQDDIIAPGDGNLNYPDKDEDHIDTTAPNELMPGDGSLIFMDKDDNKPPPEDHFDTTAPNELTPGDGNLKNTDNVDNNTDQVETTVRTESIHGDGTTPRPQEGDHSNYPNEVDTIAPIELMLDDDQSHYPDDVGTTARTDFMFEDVYSDYPGTTARTEDTQP